MEPFSTTFTIDRKLALRANRAVYRRLTIARLIIAALLLFEGLLFGWWWSVLLAACVAVVPEVEMRRQLAPFGREPLDCRVTVSEATCQVETPDARATYGWSAFRSAERSGEFCILTMRHLGRLWLPLGALAPLERGVLEAHLRGLGLLVDRPPPGVDAPVVEDDGDA